MNVIFAILNSVVLLISLYFGFLLANHSPFYFFPIFLVALSLFIYFKLDFSTSRHRVIFNIFYLLSFISLVLASLTLLGYSLNETPTPEAHNYSIFFFNFLGPVCTTIIILISLSRIGFFKAENQDINNKEHIDQL